MNKYTDADREREATLARQIETAWGFTLYRLWDSSPVDYCATDINGVPRAWVELKCRKTAHDKYDSLMVNTAKVIKLQNWVSATGLPAFIVAGYSDGARWVNVNRITIPYDVRIGGRPYEDPEPVLFIPNRDFRILGTGQ